MIHPEKNIISQLRFFLKDNFDLVHDKENDLVTMHEIKKSVEITFLFSIEGDQKLTALSFK